LESAEISTSSAVDNFVWGHLQRSRLLQFLPVAAWL